MAFIKVIQHSEAEGRLKEVYDNLIETRGKLAEVHKIQSLNPDTIVAHMDLYMKIMFGKSPVRRYQREMIAVIVSANNNCEYCIKHHGDALNHFWKDQEKVDQLAQNFRTPDLSPVDDLYCQWAAHLTNNPHLTTKEGLTERMKENGISDRAILDATLVIAYFNFVNRIVMGLGVELENEGGKGYKYD